MDEFKVEYGGYEYNVEANSPEEALQKARTANVLQKRPESPSVLRDPVGWLTYSPGEATEEEARQQYMEGSKVAAGGAPAVSGGMPNVGKAIETAGTTYIAGAGSGIRPTLKAVKDVVTHPKKLVESGISGSMECRPSYWGAIRWASIPRLSPSTSKMQRPPESGSCGFT